MGTYMIIACLLGVSVLSDVCEAQSKFPPFIQVCKRNSDAFKCITENIERCRPFFAKGIPRLLIPSLEPLTVPELDISGNNLHVHLRNVRVHNLPSMQIAGKIAFDDFKLVLKLRMPYVFNEFDYDVKGRLLVLALNSRGKGYTNATDIQMDIIAKAHPETKEGKVFLVPDDVHVSYKSGNGEFHVDNLFMDNEDLTEQTNRFISQNFVVFEDEIKPFTAKSIADVLKTIATNVFKKYTYDELFPLE